MRIKKYKRVKRPVVCGELPVYLGGYSATKEEGSIKDARHSSRSNDSGVRTDGYLDVYGAHGAEDLVGVEPDTDRRRSTSPQAEIDENSFSICAEDRSSTAFQEFFSCDTLEGSQRDPVVSDKRNKSGCQKTNEGPNLGVAPAATPNNVKTPFACPRSMIQPQTHDDGSTSLARDEMGDRGEFPHHHVPQSDELSDDVAYDEDTNKDSGFPGRGSLWFKTERILCFLQFLAISLDVDGAAWPSLFTRTWGWTRYALDYLRRPMVALLHRVGSEFTLAFGNARRDLWFFRDIVGYGAEVYAAVTALFFLFFALQIPDYTTHEPQAAWNHRFKSHWIRSSLRDQTVKLCLCYACLTSLNLFGFNGFPTLVKATTVVLGTAVTLWWFIVVVLSFLLHLKMRSATNDGGDFSIVIVMVRSDSDHMMCASRGGILAHPVGTASSSSPHRCVYPRK